MIIKQHAIRRYRKRAGARRMSKERVVRDIQQQIKHHAKSRKYNKDTGQYRVVTPKFIAVCERNTVITILYPPGLANKATTHARR